MAIQHLQRQRFKPEPTFGQSLQQALAQSIGALPGAALGLIGQVGREAWQKDVENEASAAEGRMKIDPRMEALFSESNNPIDSMRLQREAERVKRLTDEKPVLEAMATPAAPAPMPSVQERAEPRLQGFDKVGEVVSPTPRPEMPPVGNQAPSGLFKSSESYQRSTTNPYNLKLGLEAARPTMEQNRQLFDAGFPTQQGLEGATQENMGTLERLARMRARQGQGFDYAAANRVLKDQQTALPGIANATTSSRNSLAGLSGQDADLLKAAMGVGRESEQGSVQYRQWDAKKAQGARTGGGAGAKKLDLNVGEARKEYSENYAEIQRLEKERDSLKPEEDQYGQQDLVGFAMKKEAYDREIAQRRAVMQGISRRMQEDQGYVLGPSAGKVTQAGQTVTAKEEAAKPFRDDRAAELAKARSELASRLAALRSMDDNKAIQTFRSLATSLQSVTDPEAKAMLQDLMDQFKAQNPNLFPSYR
jgi:hypothetical protein